MSDPGTGDADALARKIFYLLVGGVGAYALAVVLYVLL